MRLRTGILILIALVLVVVGRVNSQAENDIIVQYADTRVDLEITPSQDLIDLLGTVASRFFVQWADTLVHGDIDPPPAELTTLLDSVAPRLILQWGDTMKHGNFDPPPASLEDVLAAVAPRLFIQWADTAYQQELAYPADLIDDETAPTIINVTTIPSGVNAIITWTTDEFADSEVLYGTSPGNYPFSVADPLYTHNHQLTLTNLQPGTTYYYRAQSTDLSGNTMQSPEQSFVFEVSVETHTFIPIVTRH